VGERADAVERGRGAAAPARLPTVAVVGRANVGKSTLVNRLLGRREAIEHPEPGVTRDPRAYPLEWGGLTFAVVDTGGWEPRARGLAAKVVAQAERAAGEADLVLLVVDVTTGVTADDLAVARALRRARAPVVVVANKVDSAAAEPEVGVFERLGLGPALPVSALHGRGAGDLLDVVAAHLRDAAGRRAPSDAAQSEGAAEEVRVAIVGRPNVGKSSLFNRLVGDERAIVDERPGTTRDAIDTVVTLGERRFRFVDTAGMRRRARQAAGPDYYGLVRSLRALDEAEVALLVIDAAEGPTEQDARIAERIARSGRAAVIVLNKWDLLDAEGRERVASQVAGRLRFVPWAEVVRTSARTGRGVGRVLPAVERARASWEQRVPTADLNAWLREVADRIPLGAGPRPTKIRYATQARARPPEVVLFTTGPVAPAALRALERRLRERFGFEGTPVRLVVRARGSGRRR
jgi:GTP-binding protein